MKTDRFSDSIRRKLESIRPDFSEKDWQRMQATLQHATPPPSGSPTAPQPWAGSAWSAQPWLLAAAAVSTVVLISLAIYQRNQISDLRQTVRQLSGQQTTRPRPTPADPNAVALSPNRPNPRGETRPGTSQPSVGRNEPAAHQPDTVYVTRYVAPPARPAPGRTAQRASDAPSSDRPDRIRSVASVPPQQPDQSATTDRSHDGADDASPRADGPTNGLPSVPDNQPGTLNPPIRRADERLAMPSKSQPADNASGRRKRRSPADVTETVTPGATAGDENTTAAPVPPVTGSASGEVSQPVSTYTLTASRPLTLNVIDWSNALARQAKRMRPVRTTTGGGPEAPVNQPASQPVRVAFGFRLGAGVELSRNVRSGSLQTELLIGKHLTLGVGLGVASFAGGTFLTPEKFDERKGMEHKPGGFKREYVYNHRINPLSDITNIGVHTNRVQIPFSLGYRIPVSQTLSLLPSVGTTLGMRSKEYVTFTFREPFGSYQGAKLPPIPRPTNLINNLTFGANVEWKRSHWAWQAGPVLTVPLVADANWQESAAVGLRARVFYQF